MKVKDKVVKIIDAGYNDQELTKSMSFDGNVLNYVSIELSGYKSKMEYKRNKLYVSFGCRQFDHEKVKNIVQNFNSGPAIETCHGLTKTNTQGKNSLVRVKIIEESENFFISISNKAYSKENHVATNYKKETSILKWNKSIRGYYSSHSEGYYIEGNYIGSNRETVGNKIDYLAQIFEEVEKITNNKQHG